MSVENPAKKVKFDIREMYHEPKIISRSFELTESEEDFFRVIREIIEKNGLSTVARVAGGWVRDKLLQKGSEDIDIALDNMMGKDFAELFVLHLGLQRTDGSRSVHVIECNPEQSKHLETARVHYQGNWLDFVNLRSESYANNSRIPVIEIGTPVEDALRRDFTVNALFYNINTDSIEDYSNIGLSDLRDGIIRTPLPATETFRDDPLRVMRCIRFATRLGFRYEETTMNALCSPEIHGHLSGKVSRERIGTELLLMLRGRNPASSVRDIVRFGLFSSLFEAPPKPYRFIDECVTNDNENNSIPLPPSADLLYSRIRWLLDQISPPFPLDLQTEQKDVLLISAILASTRGIFHGKGFKESIVFNVVSKALKLKKSTATSVGTVLNQLSSAFEAWRLLKGSSSSSKEEELRMRVVLGKIVRSSGKDWISVCLLGHCLSVESESNFESDSELERFAARYSETMNRSILVEAVRELQLENAYNLKPLLNGNSIMKLNLQVRGGIGKLNPGKELKLAIDELISWQLKFPENGIEEAKAFLQSLQF